MVDEWRLSTYEGKLLVSLVLMSSLAVGLYKTSYSVTSVQGNGGGVATVVSGTQSSIPPSVYHFETAEPLQPIAIQPRPSYAAPAPTVSQGTSTTSTTTNSKSSATSSTSVHSNKLTDFLKKLF